MKVLNRLENKGMHEQIKHGKSIILGYLQCCKYTMKCLPPTGKAMAERDRIDDVLSAVGYGRWQISILMATTVGSFGDCKTALSVRK